MSGSGWLLLTTLREATRILTDRDSFTTKQLVTDLLDTPDLAGRQGKVVSRRYSCEERIFCIHVVESMFHMGDVLCPDSERETPDCIAKCRTGLRTGRALPTPTWRRDVTQFSTEMLGCSWRKVPSMLEDIT